MNVLTKSLLTSFSVWTSEVGSAQTVSEESHKKTS